MNTVLLKDPRIDINNPHDMERVIRQSGSRVTQYSQKADSTSTSTSSFSFQPPSTKTITDRRMLLKMRVKIDVVGGGNDKYLELGITSGLRQCPLASIMNSVDVRVNGGSFSDNISRRIHAMLRYNNSEFSRSKYLSKTASMPDQFQNYRDWETKGSNRNPLASYGEVGYESSRGAVVLVASTKTPGGTEYDGKKISVTYEITEPIFISPLLTGLEHQDAGLVNVNQIDVVIQWTSNKLSRVLSHYAEGGNTLTGKNETDFNVTFPTTPEMLTTFITPQSQYMLPSLQVLPYSKYNDYVTDKVTVLAGAQFTIETPTIKLNQIPKHVMFFVKRSRTTENANTTDTYAEIENINLLWNNESSLLSTTTSEGLYDISLDNGCNMTYPQFKQYCGGVVVLSFPNNINLPSGLTAGVLGQYTLRAEIRCRNQQIKTSDVYDPDADIEFEGFMSVMLEGSTEISENSLSSQLGNILVEEVLHAEMNAPQVHHTHNSVSGGGFGSFFSKVKHFVNKVSRGVGKAAQFVGKNIAPVISAINPEIGAVVGTVAKTVGDVSNVARKATGGARGRRIRGGAAAGGARGRPRKYLR